jgi:pimeloyl-ACP methyl ester carboxylesterase
MTRVVPKRPAAGCRAAPRVARRIALSLTLGALPMFCAAPDLVAQAATDGTTPEGVRWWAEGEGPGVVLLHAFTLDRRMWDPVAADLSRDHRVVRLDARGHGESAPAEGPYSSWMDVRTVMDAAGVDRAVVVGLSSGAQTAVDLALGAPDRVSGLVLASPAVSGYRPQGSFEWMSPVGEALRGGGPQAATEAWLATPLMVLPEGAAETARLREIAMDNVAIWTLTPHPDQPPEPAAATRLGEIRVPTLIFTGVRDLFDTRFLTGLLDYCVVERTVKVVDSGHLVPLEQPRAFLEGVRGFLAGDPAPPRMDEPPPGCQAGEDLMGPGSLAPLARIVGGSWELGGFFQEFEWGVGRRSVKGRMIAPGKYGPRVLSEFTWYWHPEKGAFEGRGVAIEMGVDLFEYTTWISGDTLVSDLRSFTGTGAPDAQREMWVFEHPDQYLWQLFEGAGEPAPGAAPQMDGRFRRRWHHPDPQRP